jgi:hypothetical protein
MKICKDCQKFLPINDFRLKPSNKDGRETRCRACRNFRYNKQDPLKVFKQMYYSQVVRSVDRGHPAPAYTLDQFYHWLDAQPNLPALWDAWVASGFSKDLRPSVDRLDDYKPYTFDNIQLITWRENLIKGAHYKKIGLNNKANKPVTAYHLDGTIYKTYHSIIEAARQVGGNMWGVWSVAHGKPITKSDGTTYQPRTYKGFVWKLA